MALRWDWSDKMGECILDTGEKINLYQGNGLAIAIREYEDETYNLVWFWADKEHMKTMLGLRKAVTGYDNCMKDWGIKKFRLNTQYKTTPDIVTALAKAKMTIEIELYSGKEEQDDTDE